MSARLICLRAHITFSPSQYASVELDPAGHVTQIDLRVSARRSVKLHGVSTCKGFFKRFHVESVLHIGEFKRDV